MVFHKDIYECITLNFYWSGIRSGVYDHVRGGQQINQKICHFLFYFSWILDERNLVSSLAIQINQFKQASIKRRFECSPSNEQWQFFTQEQPLKSAVCLYFFCLFNDYSSQQKYHLILVLDLTYTEQVFFLQKPGQIVLSLLKERAWGYLIEDTCYNIVYYVAGCWSWENM